MTKTSIAPLKVEQLYAECDLAHIPFKTSDEVTEHNRIVGQERALDAIHFGTRITGPGYNVFALGPAGTGKYTVVRHILEIEAQNKPTPSDWCYVYNFDQPHKPNALQLPAGRGIALRKDMDQLTEDLSTAIPTAFESEDYQAQIDKLEQDFATRRDEALNELADDAKKQDVQLIHTPSGFAFAPLDKNNEVIRPDRFEKLPDDEKQRIENAVAELQKRMQRIIRQFPAWQKETREKVKEIDRQIARLAVNHLD